MSIIDEQVSLLEDALVSEFRLLQKLVAVTQQENTTLLTGNPSILMPLVENKETLLDQLGRQEKNRQKLAESIAQAQGIATRPVTVQCLLPCLGGEQADRIRRLADGILALSEQGIGLNISIGTLSQSWIDMIRSTQAYLLSFYQSPATYQPPGTRARELAPVSATEHCA